MLDFKQRPWATTPGGGEGILGATKDVYRLKLRVTPEGEDAFAAEITDEWSQLSDPPVIGMKVPVLFDPEHHDRVVLDAEWSDEQRVGLRQHWASEEQAAGPGSNDAPGPMSGSASIGQQKAAEPTPSPEQEFYKEAVEFRKATEAFRDQVEASNRVIIAGDEKLSEQVGAILRAQASGDTAEVERLKSELQQHAAEGSGSPSVLHLGASPVSHDPLDQLQKLADLHDRGALTDEEFATAKAMLLNEN